MSRLESLPEAARPTEARPLAWRVVGSVYLSPYPSLEDP
jgi:hypothetical protein